MVWCSNFPWIKTLSARWRMEPNEDTKDHTTHRELQLGRFTRSLPKAIEGVNNSEGEEIDRGAWRRPCGQLSCLEETPEHVELPTYYARDPGVQLLFNISSIKPYMAWDSLDIQSSIWEPPLILCFLSAKVITSHHLTQTRFHKHTIHGDKISTIVSK